MCRLRGVGGLGHGGGEGAQGGEVSRRQAGTGPAGQGRRAAQDLPLQGFREATGRLADVATVDDSVQDLRNGGLADGKPAVLRSSAASPGPT